MQFRTLYVGYNYCNYDTILFTELLTFMLNLPLLPPTVNYQLYSIYYEKAQVMKGNTRINNPIIHSKFVCTLLFNVGSFRPGIISMLPGHKDEALTIP